MLSADLITKELPEEWDEIRNYSKRAIDALVFISILFSHHMFISVFAKSMTAEMRGILQRGDLGDKASTNLVYSMQTLGLCAVSLGLTLSTPTLLRCSIDTFNICHDA